MTRREYDASISMHVNNQTHDHIVRKTRSASRR
jgi:hypothetical protein